MKKMVVKWPMVPITRSHFQALPIIYFSLGQNKTEQVSLFSPKAMRRRRKRAKTRHFDSIEVGGGVVQMFRLFRPRL